MPIAFATELISQLYGNMEQQVSTREKRVGTHWQVGYSLWLIVETKETFKYVLASGIVEQQISTRDKGCSLWLIVETTQGRNTG